MRTTIVKKLVHYVPSRPITRTKDRLVQYNDFIREQYITVDLTEPVWTDNEFWLNNLLTGLLNGRYKLCELKLNQEIYPNDTAIGVSHIIHSKSQCSNPMSTSNHHSTSSSPSPTSTSTHTTPTPISTTSILYPTSISTLLSHIQVLILLSSTQEKSSRCPSNGDLMSSGQQLLDYFLNWLLFLNRDIRRGKNL